MPLGTMPGVEDTASSLAPALPGAFCLNNHNRAGQVLTKKAEDI